MSRLHNTSTTTTPLRYRACGCLPNYKHRLIHECQYCWTDRDASEYVLGHIVTNLEATLDPTDELYGRDFFHPLTERMYRVEEQQDSLARLRPDYDAHQDPIF